MHLEIGAVVLAAGRSTRMGSPKALLPYRGRTFVAHIVEELRRAGVGPVAVVGPADLGLLAAAVPSAPRTRLVGNPDRDRGQIASLRHGIVALPEDCPGALSCLVDHPAVTSSTYRALIDAFREGGATILIPVRGGRRGHPPLFGRSVFQEILDCPDDGGARNGVGRDPTRVREVAVDDPGIHVDVDTPADFRALE